MTVKHARAIFAAALLLLVCTCLAKADTVVYKNLPPVANTDDDSTATGTVLEANLFATDNHVYQLTTVTLLLGEATDNTVLPGVAIYTNNNGLPGTLVGTLTPNQSSYSSAFANATFTASGITLNPNTDYWVVLSANSCCIGWADTTVADSSKGNGVSFQISGFQPMAAASFDSGVSWPNVSPTFIDQMQVDATTATSVVPEPSSLLLLSSGLLGLVGAIRTKLFG